MTIRHFYVKIIQIYYTKSGNYMQNTQVEQINDLMYQIALCQYTDTDKMFLLCKELKTLAQLANDRYAIAFALYYLTDYALNADPIEEVIKKLNITIEACEGFDDLLLKSYNLYGVIKCNLDDYSTGVDYYLKALNKAILLNDYSIQASINSNLADTFSKLKEYDLALPYCLEALENTKMITDHSRKRKVEMITLINLADIYVNIDEYQKAYDLMNNFDPTIGGRESSSLAYLASAYRIYAMYYLGLDVLTEIKNVIDEDRNCMKSAAFNEEELQYIAGSLLLNISYKIKDRKLVNLFINVLEKNSFVDNNLKFKKEILDYKIKYFDYLDTNEDLMSIYKQFYEYSLLDDAHNLKVSVENVKMKLKLSETLESNTKLQKMSWMDELCNIPNRRSLRNLFDEIMLSPNYKKMAIIIFDIDEFKEYNDQFGHIKGDELLKLFASCISYDQRVHPHRFGGDEFITVCVDLDDVYINNYIETVFDKFSTLQDLNNINNTTISCGYSNANISEIKNIKEIIDQADKALYQVKNNNKNCYQKYTNNY